MTAPICIRCGRPTDAYLCVAETTRATGQLAEIGRLVEDARMVAYGLSGRTEGSGGSRKPGSRSPGNDDALDALDEIQGELTGLVRMIEGDRGAEIVSAGLGDATQADPLVWACSALSAQVEWLRHQAWADEALDVVEKCVRRIRGVVDGPSPKRYLGPCGAARPCEGLVDGDWPEADCGYHVPHQGHDQPACEGDVYGTVGGKTGTCRTCGAQVDQGERRAWLDDQVRDVAFRAAHVADAYGLNVKTIRSWADRGHLLEHGTDRHGKPLYLVGEVLDLARAAAIRRAENEARRERRESVEEASTAA